jgi:hypothetical protein
MTIFFSLVAIHTTKPCEFTAYSTGGSSPFAQVMGPSAISSPPSTGDTENPLASLDQDLRNRSADIDEDTLNYQSVFDESLYDSLVRGNPEQDFEPHHSDLIDDDSAMYIRALITYPVVGRRSEASSESGSFHLQLQTLVAD